jgi:hypothetical protein
MKVEELAHYPQQGRARHHARHQARARSAEPDEPRQDPRSVGLGCTADGGYRDTAIAAAAHRPFRRNGWTFRRPDRHRTEPWRQRARGPDRGARRAASCGGPAGGGCRLPAVVGARDPAQGDDAHGRSRPVHSRPDPDYLASYARHAGRVRLRRLCRPSAAGLRRGGVGGPDALGPADTPASAGSSSPSPRTTSPRRSSPQSSASGGSASMSIRSTGSNMSIFWT